MIKKFLLNKTNLVLLIVAFLVTPCYAQKNLDSLKTVWQDETLSNEARIEAVYTIAKEFGQTNSDSTLYYANLTFDFAEKNELRKYKADSKATQGFAYLKLGDYEASEKAYNESIYFSRKMGDSVRVGDVLYSIGIIYSNRGDYDKALEIYQRSISLMEGKAENVKMANVLNNLAIIYIRKGDYDAAAAEWERSIELYKNSSNPEERSGPMVNLAILSTRQGNYAKAIELYTQSLVIDEQAGNDYNSSYSYLNIATLYASQKEYDKFFENANKSLEIRERLGNKAGIVKCLANIGTVQLQIEEYDKALETFEKAKPIADEINLKEYQNVVYRNIGEIQIELGEFDAAYENIEMALKLAEELKDEVINAKTLSILGHYYNKTGNTSKALFNLNKAYDIVEEKDLELSKDISLRLYEIYSSKGQIKLALKNYEIHVASRDSLESEENKKEIIRQEFKYEYDKKAFKDSIAFANEKFIQETKLKKTKDERQYLFILLIIVLLFSFVLFGRIKVINKQKSTIQSQNSELNELNENLEQKVEERTKEVVEVNKKLTKSDERYSYALEASTDGIWDYDIPSDKISFSPAIYTMLGYWPYEFPESRQGIYNLLFQDDVKVKKKQEHDLFVVEGDKDFFQDEYRLLSKQGKIIWVLVKGKIVERNDKGEPTRIVGTHTNITAAKMRNQQMLEAVLRTEDAERSRIAKEIHDGLQQTLTISNLNFRNHKNEIKDLDEVPKDAFSLGWEYLQKSLVESRSVAHSLMPKSIVDYGVLPAIEKMIDDLNRSSEEIDFLFFHNLKGERLPNQQIEITIYRILQESINNILKYAKATRVDVQFKDYDDIYMLTIEDNGVGFDTSILQNESKGLGFQSMKNRLDAINGVLEVDSTKGRGTIILVKINKSKLV